MTHASRLLTFVFLFSALISPVLAEAETVRLADGESVQLMHPGVDGVRAPRAIRTSIVAPDYPLEAWGLGIDSQVMLGLLVRDDGSVAAAEVVRAEHPGRGFEAAALDAVLGWRFTPARRGKTRFNSYAFVSLDFKAPEGNLPGAADRTAEPALSAVLAGGRLYGGSAAVGAFSGASHLGRPTGINLPPRTPGTLYRPSQLNPALNIVRPLPRVVPTPVKRGG